MDTHASVNWGGPHLLGEGLGQGAENAAGEAKAGELGEVMMEHGIQKLAPEFTHRPGMPEKRH